MKKISIVILLLMTSVLIFTGCGNIMPSKTAEKQTVTSINLAETDWDLKQGEDFKGKKKESVLTFYENGKFTNHNPRSQTPDDEIWSVEGNQLTFSFNSGYATYIGTISNDGNQIAGTAHNKNGHKWSWTATRK